MRMYNLAMHLKGVDVYNVPWKYVHYWSRTLESDLTQRRLEQMTKGRR